MRSDQRTMAPPSDAHMVALLKWPIVFFLAFTSFPAGFMPFMAIGSYRDIRHEEQVSPKWRVPARVESAKKTLRIGLRFSAAAGTVHLVLVGLAWRKRNGRLLGLRGAGWFAMAWGAFAVGVVMGGWIFNAAAA